MSRVLVVGDPHCPAMHPRYPTFLSRVAKKYKTNRTVFIGDVVDWHAASYHLKHSKAGTAHQEYYQAKGQVKRLNAIFPKADVMVGNHDSLPSRRLEDLMLPPEVLLRGYADLWETPKWTWHPRYSFLEIDGVLYNHGETGKGGMDAALKNAKEQFCSYVMGHLHSQAGVRWAANQSKLIFGMTVGCGVDYNLAAMEYGKKFNAKPVVGCGVVIDGKQAIFEPMDMGGKK